MSDELLGPRIIHMPEVAPGTWLQSDRPPTRSELRGRVLLIEFWDYACINCLRTLPYLRRWHRRYAQLGLSIIGIHTPEFRFAQIRPFVETAVSSHNIQYPILLDNQYQNWDRWANKAWPTRYLVDPDGYIRYRRRGEGYYQETEQALQHLLRLRDPDVTLPELLPPLRDEDRAGAVCYRPTPELYAGYQGGGLFGGALGNPEGYVPAHPTFYELPPADERAAGHFYVDGVWRAHAEAMAYAGNAGGRIVLPYQAATVNGVLSPSVDPVELRLGLRPTADAPLIEVRQNGRFLTPANAGPDVKIDENGRSTISVTEPRLYQIIKNPDFRWHELDLTFQAQGLALFAFSFSTCVALFARRGDPNTIQIN